MAVFLRALNEEAYQPELIGLRKGMLVEKYCLLKSEFLLQSFVMGFASDLSNLDEF